MLKVAVAVSRSGLAIFSGFYVFVCNMAAKSLAKKSAQMTTSRFKVLLAEF